MQTLSLQNVAVLFIRMVAILIILSNVRSLCLSPALLQRTVGEDTHFVVQDVTLWAGEKGIGLPAKTVRVLTVMFYLGQAFLGAVALYFSGPLGRWLCLRLP